MDTQYVQLAKDGQVLQRTSFRVDVVSHQLMGGNSVGFSKWQNRHLLPMYAIPLIILWTGILGKFWSTFPRVLGGDIQKSERGMARMQKQERKIWLRV